MDWAYGVIDTIEDVIVSKEHFLVIPVNYLCNYVLSGCFEGSPSTSSNPPKTAKRVSSIAITAADFPSDKIMGIDDMLPLRAIR